MIVGSGIGPISDTDIQNAEQSNAILIGFNLPFSEILTAKI